MDQLPNLREVWQVSKDSIEVEGGNIDNLHCKTRRAIFIRCDADIEYKIDGKLYKEQVQFSYLDIVSAPRSATIVRSASNPALVTLDVAVDKIWNQVAGFAILMSAFAIFAFFACSRWCSSFGVERSFSRSADRSSSWFRSK
jgi:hypothetical protein